MKVVNPNDTEHLIVIILRYGVLDSLFLDLYNEGTQINTTVVPIITSQNGLTTLVFDFTFKNDERYQMKVRDNAFNVYYRDIIKVTSQNTQNFKSVNGLYYYE